MHGIRAASAYSAEALGPGVITLDMRDRNGELVMLDPPNAVALARRLLGAAMYWIDMHHIGDREAVVEARDFVNSALELEWE